MYEISREYWFCAAHQLNDHPKCGRLHGHNYKVVVTVSNEHLGPPHWWLMDFGTLDSYVKPLIDQVDHRYIASEQNYSEDDVGWLIAEMPEDWIIKLPIAASTAECIANWFYRELNMILGSRFDVRVEVWETHKSKAVSYVGS